MFRLHSAISIREFAFPAGERFLLFQEPLEGFPFPLQLALFPFQLGDQVRILLSCPSFPALEARGCLLELAPYMSLESLEGLPVRGKPLLLRLKVRVAARQ